MKPAFFSHWKEMLKIAKHLCIFKTLDTSARLGHMASAIILSHTALDSFLNETIFTVKMSASNSLYKMYMEEHIVAKIRLLAKHMRIQNVENLDFDSINLTSGVRNYTIHYTASTQKKELKDRVLILSSTLHDDNTENSSIDELIFRSEVADWVNTTICNTIEFLETNRDSKSPFSANNVAFCQSLRRHS